jgi:hypothetical protein
MNAIAKQCQIQLKRELDDISARLQQATDTNGLSDFNPVSWEMVPQMLITKELIEKALERLVNGQFGLCQKCGHPINAERLLAIPYAKHCIECQRQTERNAFHRLQRSPLNTTYQLKGELSCTTSS